MMIEHMTPFGFTIKVSDKGNVDRTPVVDRIIPQPVQVGRCVIGSAGYNLPTDSELEDKIKNSLVSLKEVDPLGKDPHEMGAKLDAGKPRMSLVLGGFARALTEVAKVGTYGANKYTDNGWMEVPDGINRYLDADMRHKFAAATGETHDKDTKLLHAAHAAWNALAHLDLLLREEEKK